MNGIIDIWLPAILMIPQDWIMEQWEKNYYISSIAGAVNGSSLVVMSKGLIITHFCNIYRFMTYTHPTPFWSLHMVSTIFMYIIEELYLAYHCH